VLFRPGLLQTSLDLAASSLIENLEKDVSHSLSVEPSRYPESSRGSFSRDGFLTASPPYFPPPVLTQARHGEGSPVDSDATSFWGAQLVSLLSSSIFSEGDFIMVNPFLFCRENRFPTVGAGYAQQWRSSVVAPSFVAVILFLSLKPARIRCADRIRRGDCLLRFPCSPIFFFSTAHQRGLLFYTERVDGAVATRRPARFLPFCSLVY